MAPLLSYIGLQSREKPVSPPSRQSLRIRNLTGSPLELILVERYRAPTPDWGSYLQFNSTTAVPSATTVAENARNYVLHRLNLELAPFTITKTDISSPALKDVETVRLTFSVDGEKYRMDCPPASKHSQSLHPLLPKPKHKFTSVFLPESAFVCLYNSADLDSWMQFLQSATPLSALSIPGTHNSPTCYPALPSVRCQTTTIAEQLDNGVRFLDVRVQPESSTSARLILMHSVFPISFTGPKYFHDLERALVDFLEAHPSETLLLSLKREGTGSWEGLDLAMTLYTHHLQPPAPHSSRWYSTPRIPTLGEARGKIVLIRRFPIPESQQTLNDGAGLGIDASIWADNCACDVQETICVQDFYEVLTPTSIELKVRYVADHFERAGAAVASLPGINTDMEHPVPPGPLFVNFASASNFWRRGCWPERVAKVVNPKVVASICEDFHVEDGEGADDKMGRKEGNDVAVVGEKSGDGGAGIVVCDWVGANGDWDLVRCIVGCNSRLMTKQRFMVTNM